MATPSDEDEARLKRQFLAQSELDKIVEPPLIDQVLPETLRQTNVQTGTRDLLILAITSFFALLLVFCAPLLAASAKKGSSQRSPSG